MDRAEQRYPALRLHYQAKSGQLASSVQRRTTCQMMNMMKRDLEALKIMACINNHLLIGICSAQLCIASSK
jgi:hypothetical protein